MSVKTWIAAARLRTLPLAFSCILLGTFIAVSHGHFDLNILIWSFLTTLLYQVLSNYANDYGDGVKGTDDSRQGEKRAVASGEISAGFMRKAVWALAIASWGSGAYLSYLGTQSIESWVFYLFLVLNTGAVSSAIRYTVGGSAYGYKGFGDVYVLIFFGWIGVLGSYFLQTHSLNPWVIFPASAIGLIAVGVLNLNNMRDLENDVLAGKITVPVRIGRKKAKVYHGFLLSGAVLFMIIYLLNEQSPYAWLSLLISPVLFVQLKKALKANSPMEFDPLLKPLAITALLFALWTGIALNLETWISL